MPLFRKNKKKFTGTVNIDGKNMAAQGDATEKDDGTYELSGTAGTMAETKSPVETPRHGGCDETTNRRMEQRVSELV